MSHEAESVLREWGAIADAEGRLIVPNGSIAWSKAPHGWYRQQRGHVDKAGVRHEWAGLVHQLTRGGADVSPFLTPEQWENREDLVARQKALIDDLEPRGLDAHTLVLPWVQDRLEEARAAARDAVGDEALVAESAFWDLRLKDLQQLTWLVAWPDEWVVANYSQGIADREARREKRATKKEKADARRERAAAKRGN